MLEIIRDPAFLIVVTFLISTSISVGFSWLWQSWRARKRAEVERRLGPRSSTAIPLVFEEDQPPANLLRRFDRWFDRLVGEAGMDFHPRTVFLFSIAVGLVLGGCLLLWRDDPLLGTLGLLAGLMLVIVYLMYRRNTRRSAIQEQLPEVLELLARAVRAGESLDQAIGLVGNTAAAPMGPEFRRCAQKLDMGLSVDATMRSLARRAPLSEVRIFSSALMVQRRTGGNLALTLERLSNVVRDRLSYHRQFKAATGAGRVSTLIIAAAGPLVAAYMLIWQREYILRFTDTFPGQVLLGTAVALQVIGLIWIWSLLRSDY